MALKLYQWIQGDLMPNKKCLAKELLTYVENIDDVALISITSTEFQVQFIHKNKKSCHQRLVF